ncbi:glycosyltransferase family 4 protein [Paenibacillus sp. NPDC056579]|uniref:glycosyltransferase family 4 protein n=1 Tax=Paenibacillus sp. NPDC056579 TaxID=3345871 RepID=UPI0036878AD3
MDNPMKVIMDATPLMSQKTGVGYYTVNLVKQFLKTNNNFNLNLAINGIKPSKPIHTGVGSVNKILIPYDKLRDLNLNPTLYNGLKLEFITGNFDVFHGTNFHSWPTYNAKKVITFHDLAFIKYPELMPQHIVKHHAKWAIHSLYNSDMIITVSQSVRNEIIDYFNFDPEKVMCTPLAASEQFFRRDQNQLLKNVKAKYGLPDSFLLYVGTLEPRKNILRMIEAYYKAKKDSGLEQKLVLVGSKGLEIDTVFHKINKLNLSKDVIIPGYVEENDLPLIYNAADAFIYVSMYEGFGLPILEAMKSGIPVITSNISSMPEVAGDAASLVDPLDTLSISEAINKVLLDKEYRNSLSLKGLGQSREFSWELTAAKTLDIYKKVLNYK